MSTPTECVFDLATPRRPGSDDVGGCAKVDDQVAPPNPQTMLTANDVNQWANLLVRYAAVLPVAILSIHYTGGNPAISSLACAKTSLTASSFTLVANNYGDVTISWAAGTFPARTADHEAIVTGTTPGYAVAQTLTNSARVLIRNYLGAATNIPFNLKIYGD